MQLDKSFVKFCKQHGWTILEAVIEAATAATITRNAEFLQMLCLERDKNPERIALCARLSERAVEVQETFDERPPEADWRVRHVDRSVLFGSLVKAMLAIDAVKPLSRLIDHALASVDKYNLTDSHLVAIFVLESWLAKLVAPNPALSHWLAACRRELENRTAHAPQKPADYRRPHELSCNCSDCSELSRFLAISDQREHRFAVAQARRQHLHQIIERNRCDLTHVTERRGGPYTLVCTKTTASYDAACDIHQRDLKNLSRIIALGRKIG